MATDFSELTLEQAQALVDAQVPDWLDENEAFFEGDHWQDGDGWVGPRPKAGETGFDDTMDELEAAFTSRNVVLEVVERHTTGVVGREPVWSLTPKRDLEEGEEPAEAEQALIGEAEAFLASWLEERRVLELMQGTRDEGDIEGSKGVVDTLLWAGRSAIRLYVPSGLRKEGTVPEGELEEQLERLYVDSPHPTTATVWTDPDTRAELGIVIWERPTNPEDPSSKQTQTVAELSFLDPDGGDDPETIIRTLAEGEEEPEPTRINLGGRLPVFELRRRPLINEQVRQGQKALNLANSNIPRTVVTSGFLERVLLNAQMPGEWETDDTTGMPTKFKPDPFHFGAGSVNALVGVPMGEDDQGRERIATPAIEYREPTDIKPSEDAKRSHYQDILEETDQVHILISGDATASGISRQRAREDFVASLRLTKSRTDPAFAWLLETALAMAEAFAGDPGQYTGELEVACNCQLSPGPVTPEEQEQNNKNVKEGTLSRETAMALSGVEDVPAEVAAIEGQEDARLAMRERQLQAIGVVTTIFERATPTLAAKLVGLMDLDPEGGEDGEGETIEDLIRELETLEATGGTRETDLRAVLDRARRRPAPTPGPEELAAAAAGS